MQPNKLDSVPIIALAIACTIGLCGAFVGLDTSSFWVDELFTGWVVGSHSAPAEVVARLVTDNHPPLYYSLLYLFSNLTGTSDAALRLFSAICASLAILVFVHGLRRRLSLPARLFGAAIATASSYWFYNAQNARSYAMAMLVAAIILALSISTLEARDRSTGRNAVTLALLFLVTTVGALTHYYFVFLNIAVLCILALYARELRFAVIALMIAVTAIAFLYLKLVTEHFDQFETSASWMQNNFGWYKGQLLSARAALLNKPGLLALGICAAWCVPSLPDYWRKATRRLQRSRPGAWGVIAAAANGVDPVIVLLAGVPVLVVIGAVASSVILSPNFSDRNFMICSPFIWGTCAWLYDAGIQRAPRSSTRLTASIAVAAITLSMSAMVAGRMVPRNPPHRESSQWIKTFESCRGQVIPVLDTFSEPGWTKPRYLDEIGGALFGRYLSGFATPRLILTKAAPPEDLKAALQERLDGRGCPIVAWAALAVYPATIDEARMWLSTASGRPQLDQKRIKARVFGFYSTELRKPISPTLLYVLYVDGSAP